jgi:hypothetical protein
MIIIYVQKNWLVDIGSTADNFLIDERADNYSCLYASSTEMEGPFLLAKLARTKATEHGEAFLTAHIPVDVIRGIFDLTEAERKKLGF